MLRTRPPLVLALLLPTLLTPLIPAPAARAADLVVWWDQGYYPDEDAAIAEVVAAFEAKSGKQVELVQQLQWEMEEKVRAAIEAGAPPDFLYGIATGVDRRWAYDDRLVDLTDAVGSLRDLFDSDLLVAATMVNGSTGRSGLYALPMGRQTDHVHVWKSLLEQAGLRLDDIPKDWGGFWSFWCDRVQPAVRKATGRDDIWGVGLAMSVDASDVDAQHSQFASAYRVFWAGRDGRLTVDDPEVRARLVQALDSYTSIYRQGCTPPDATSWGESDNNEAFLSQRVVMTLNPTLSVPNALKHDRPDDYYKHTATIAWPSDAYGQPLAIDEGLKLAAVFRNEPHVAVAKDFVRFLVADGWLAHYANFTHERVLPPMSKLLNAPFWLDPADPHRMAAAIQVLTQPRFDLWVVSEAANWRLEQVAIDKVWPKAVHRVAADGITPEQAVDEAILRIKEIAKE